MTKPNAETDASNRSESTPPAVFTASIENTVEASSVSEALTRARPYVEAVALKGDVQADADLRAIDEAIAGSSPAMKCAECTCDNPPDECNWIASAPTPLAGADTLDAWIEEHFSGHGMAMRRENDPPIPGEPLMSMAVAKDLVRRAVADKILTADGAKDGCPEGYVKHQETK